MQNSKTFIIFAPVIKKQWIMEDFAFKAAVHVVCIDNKHYKRLKYILREFRKAGVVIDPNEITHFLITGSWCHLVFMYGTNNFSVRLWLNSDGAVEYGTCECCGYNFGGLKEFHKLVDYLKYWGEEDNYE